jgi:hypothetical protein
MIGFVAVTKLFRIMSECLFRHRIIKNRPFPGLGDYSTDMEWIAEANERIAGVFDELPPVLSSVDGKEGGAGLDPDLLAVFGMQRANLLITAASVKFALVRACYRGSLVVDGVVLTLCLATVRPEGGPLGRP